MGFRSMFVTTEYNITWPAWFREKYGSSINYGINGVGGLSSTREVKTYGLWINLAEDIQKSLPDYWDSYDDIVLVYLHECGGITRCQISKDAILWSEPESWVQTQHVMHDYCYGCSDVTTAPAE